MWKIKHEKREKLYLQILLTHFIIWAYLTIKASFKHLLRAFSGFLFSGGRETNGLTDFEQISNHRVIVTIIFQPPREFTKHSCFQISYLAFIHLLPWTSLASLFSCCTSHITYLKLQKKILFFNPFFHNVEKWPNIL